MPRYYPTTHERRSRFGHLVHSEEEDREENRTRSGKDGCTVFREVVEQTASRQGHDKSGRNLHCVRPTVTPLDLDLSKLVSETPIWTMYDATLT